MVSKYLECNISINFKGHFNGDFLKVDVINHFLLSLYERATWTFFKISPFEFHIRKNYAGVSKWRQIFYFPVNYLCF